MMMQLNASIQFHQGLCFRNSIKYIIAGIPKVVLEDTNAAIKPINSLKNGIKEATINATPYTTADHI